MYKFTMLATPQRLELTRRNKERRVFGDTVTVTVYAEDFCLAMWKIDAAIGVRPMMPFTTWKRSLIEVEELLDGDVQEMLEEE